MRRKRVGFGSFVVVCAAIVTVAAQSPTVGKLQQLAPDVYFYEGDISKGHCNNGWIIFEDYVLVIDAELRHFGTAPLSPGHALVEHTCYRDWPRDGPFI